MRRLLLLFSLLPFLSFSQKTDLQAGAAVRIITPSPLLPVSGGVGVPKDAHEKKGDLFIRALVLQQAETKLAIVNIDNLGWPAALGDRSRALIKGIPPENILIGATHTHSGPDAYAFPNEKGETRADLKYLDWCVKEVAAAVNEALDKVVAQLTLIVAEGEAKGKIAFNYYAEQLYDPRCNVIQVRHRAKDRKKERP